MSHKKKQFHGFGFRMLVRALAHCDISAEPLFMMLRTFRFRFSARKRAYETGFYPVFERNAPTGGNRLQ